VLNPPNAPRYATVKDMASFLQNQTRHNLTIN
jgi:hypothetical protein